MRRRLQKSPNFDEASIVPRGKGGSREDAPSFGVQRAQRRAAQHAEGVRARINERAGVTPEMAARIDPKLQALEEERAESIAAARAQFGHDRELLSQAIDMVHDRYDRGVRSIAESIQRPKLSVSQEEPMERSLLDVFYGRRLRKAEERPPEEDDDLPGPDEDDYDYEEPSEEEMARDPNWEHGYHPDGSRIIPEAPSGRPSSSQFRSPDVDDDYEYVDPSEEEMARSPNWEHGYHPDGSRIIPEWMHQDDEAPKPESFPRNVSVEEEDHGDREDPSLESVRQMISPRLEENPANHDPYIWSSLDRDARGKRYKKSESFAEQKEVFQKSVPFPMQMKYGPISPVRKFAR